MTWLMLAILILTILMLLIGTLSIPLGLLLIALSVGALVYIVFRTLYIHYYAFKRLQRLGGTWAGYLRHVSGLSARTGNSCFIFLNKDKNLVVDDRQNQITIDNDKIIRIAVMEAAIITKINDREIADLMGMEAHPALHAMRSWLVRNPGAKRQFMMLLYIDGYYNEDAQLNNELAFFSDLEGKGHIKELLRQPAIAVKALYVPKGTKIEELFPGHGQESNKRKIRIVPETNKIMKSKDGSDGNTTSFTPL